MTLLLSLRIHIFPSISLPILFLAGVFIYIIYYILYLFYSFLKLLLLVCASNLFYLFVATRCVCCLFIGHYYASIVLMGYRHFREVEESQCDAKVTL